MLFYICLNQVKLLRSFFLNHKHLDRINSSDVVMNEKLNNYSIMKYKDLQFFKYSSTELYQKYLYNKIYKKE